MDNLKPRHRFVQSCRLLFQRRRCRCGLLNQRGVLLGHTIHLGDRLAYLINPAALLIRGGSDFAHDIGHAGHGADNFRHRRSGFIHQRGTRTDARARVVDQAFDLFRGLGAALGQSTYFPGDYRKPTPLLTGTRRFYRRVQRQNVGLEGNAVNHVGDLGNLAGAGSDLVHGAHYAFNHVTAFLRGRGSVQGQA